MYRKHRERAEEYLEMMNSCGKYRIAIVCSLDGLLRL